MMRLAKFMALAGVASRRQAEELIRAGQIMVNGKAHKDLGQTIDETKDVIEYQQKRLRLEHKVYYLVHKPIGYVSAAKGDKGERLVTDLVPKKPSVYPVGRLDKDSSGLLLLTNDGDLAYRLTHPKFKAVKEYEVLVGQPIDKVQLTKLMTGVKLTEGLAKADAVHQLGPKKFGIILHQGWNRQIRRMAGTVGMQVVGLKRVREGEFKLGNLRAGAFKKIVIK